MKILWEERGKSSQRWVKRCWMEPRTRSTMTIFWNTSGKRVRSSAAPPSCFAGRLSSSASSSCAPLSPAQCPAIGTSLYRFCRSGNRIIVCRTGVTWMAAKPRPGHPSSSHSGSTTPFRGIKRIPRCASVDVTITRGSIQPSASKAALTSMAASWSSATSGFTIRPCSIPPSLQT